MGWDVVFFKTYHQSKFISYKIIIYCSLTTWTRCLKIALIMTSDGGCVLLEISIENLEDLVVLWEMYPKSRKFQNNCRYMNTTMGWKQCFFYHSVIAFPFVVDTEWNHRKVEGADRYTEIITETHLWTQFYTFVTRYMYRQILLQLFSQYIYRW